MPFIAAFGGAVGFFAGRMAESLAFHLNKPANLPPSIAYQSSA